MRTNIIHPKKEVNKILETHADPNVREIVLKGIILPKVKSRSEREKKTTGGIGDIHQKYVERTLQLYKDFLSKPQKDRY